MDEVRKFARDVGWVLVGSAISSITGFLLSIVLARLLGPTEVGLYRMVINIQGIGGLMAVFGISGALTKYVAQHNSNRTILSQVFTSGAVGLLVFGMSTGILLYVCSGVLSSIFTMPELAHLLRILAFAFPFSSLFQGLGGLLNGLREMKAYAFLVIVQAMLMILSSFVLISLGFGVEGATYGIVFSMVGGCLGGFYVSRRLFRFDFRAVKQNAIKLTSFGSSLLALSALSVMATYADVTLIGYFLTAKEVAYYGVAVSLANLLVIVPQAVQMITYPAMSAYWAQENTIAMQKMIDRSTKYCACLVLPVALVIGLFAKEFVAAIFGQAFIPAAVPLLVLVGARVLRGSTIVPIGGSFSGAGRPGLGLKIGTLSTALNFALNILLIPRFGILGAAVAAMSSLFEIALFLALLGRVLKLKIDLGWFALAIGLALVVVALFLAGSHFVSRYIMGTVVISAYVVIVFRYLLTREDRYTLKSLASSVAFRAFRCRRRPNVQE